MRRLCLSLIPLVLAGSLIVAAAPGAAAHPGVGDRTAGALRARVESLLPARLRHEAPSANDFVGVGFGDGLSGTFRVAGSSYHWIFGLYRQRAGFDLTVIGYENLINGSQIHSWDFNLPLGAAAVGAGMQVGHVHTGTALGPFGKIDLTFKTYQPIIAHSQNCPSTHKPLYVDRKRYGMLTGSFNFTANEGTLPDLHVTRMRGKIEREGVTHNRCPGGGGDGGHYSCGYQYVTMSDLAQDARVYFFDPSYIMVEQYFRNGVAFESHEVDAQSLGHIYRTTPTGFSVNAASLSPLMSGSLAFSAGAVSKHRGPHCLITRSPEVWSSGSVTVDSDAGAFDLTGPGLHANVVRFSRP